MAKKTPSRKSWIVTTSADRPIKDIADDLVKAGFTLGRVNDAIQSISGTASEDAVDRFRRVNGVVDVAPDDEIDIGPPGSSDTW
jgi:hypothetical protein